MGVRNPFRIDVDPETNSVTWGDYGPDAGAPNAERGPMGYVEWQTHRDRHARSTPAGRTARATSSTTTSGTSRRRRPGPFFDCAAGAKNNSRWNTGLATVPPADRGHALLRRQQHPPAVARADRLLAGGGQGPMGGPVYHYDAANPSTTKFPAYWDNKAFFGEFSQDYLAVFDVEWPDGPVDHIDALPAQRRARDQRAADHRQPDRHRVRPDGSLYVLDYGDGFFRANPDAGLYRIDYAPGNKAPRPASRRPRSRAAARR